MVFCGLVIREGDEKKLKRIYVKDSKMLTPKRREELAPKIEKIAAHIIVVRVPSCKIDSMRRKGINLNQIEAIKIAEIINMANPDVAIVDSPSYNSRKFRDYLWSKLENKKMKLICENFADKNYPVVSAASIIAKVERDERIEKIKENVKFDFGVGYAHDSRTIEFLEKLADEGKMPSYVRHTWNTVERIVKKRKQRHVLNFFKVKKKKDECP